MAISGLEEIFWQVAHWIIFILIFLIVVTGGILAQRYKKISWGRLIIIWLTLLLPYFLWTPAQKWWGERETKKANTAGAAPDKVTEGNKWYVTSFYPDGGQGMTWRARLVTDSPTVKIFQAEGKVKNAWHPCHIRLEKVTSNTWSGEWRRPGSWGKIEVTQSEDNGHFTGRWYCPDSQKPEFRQGGQLQILKQARSK